MPRAPLIANLLHDGIKRGTICRGISHKVIEWKAYRELLKAKSDKLICVTYIFEFLRERKCTKNCQRNKIFYK